MALLLRETICERFPRLPQTDDVLEARASFLRRRERDLFIAVMLRGMSSAAVARMTGGQPGTIRKRIQRIARRMQSRRFVSAIRAIPYLQEADADLARRYYCQAISCETLARHLNISHHEMRQWLNRLKAEIGAINSLRRSERLRRIFTTRRCPA